MLMKSMVSTMRTWNKNIQLMKRILCVVLIFTIFSCENTSTSVIVNDKLISEIIQKEIKGEKSLSSEQITNVSKHLVKPVKEKYVSNADSTKVFALWTVLEESSGAEKNRVIFYDEEENNFGLGIKISGKNYYWANYGNFVKTFKGM
jgi:hypothetical protein